MTRYVALLHSIILDAGARLSMAPWRTLLEDMGYRGVRTLLATGNAVFSAPEQPGGDMEARLEAAFAERFGRHVDTIVRDAEAWENLVSGNPFPEHAADEGAKVMVRVMREPVSAEAEALLSARLGEGEKMRIVRGDPWFYFPEGFSNSRVGGAFASPRSGIGTVRNWNTVARIGDMLASGGALD